MVASTLNFSNVNTSDREMVGVKGSGSSAVAASLGFGVTNGSDNQKLLELGQDSNPKQIAAALGDMKALKPALASALVDDVGRPTRTINTSKEGVTWER